MLALKMKRRELEQMANELLKSSGLNYIEMLRQGSSLVLVM